MPMLRTVNILIASSLLLASCAMNGAQEVDSAGYPKIPNIGAAQEQIDARDIAILMDIRPADDVIQGELLQAMWIAYEAALEFADPKNRFGRLKNHLIAHQTTEDEFIIWLEWRRFPGHDLDPDFQCTGEHFHCYGYDGGGTAYQVTLSRQSMEVLDITPIDP